MASMKLSWGQVHPLLWPSSDTATQLYPLVWKGHAKGHRIIYPWRSRMSWWARSRDREMLTSFTDSLFSSFAHISSSASRCPLAFIPQLLHLCWSTLRLSAAPLGSCSKPPHQQFWPSWNLWPFLPPQSPNPPAWMLCFSGLHEITLLHCCSSASFLAFFGHTPKWILLHFCRV